MCVRFLLSFFSFSFYTEARPGRPCVALALLDVKLMWNWFEYRNFMEIKLVEYWHIPIWHTESFGWQHCAACNRDTRDGKRGNENKWKNKKLELRLLRELRMWEEFYFNLNERYRLNTNCFLFRRCCVSPFIHFDQMKKPTRGTCQKLFECHYSKFECLHEQNYQPGEHR